MADMSDDDIRKAEERLFSDDEIEKAKPKEYQVEKEEKKSFFGKKQKIELKPEPRVTIKPTVRPSEPKKELTVSFYPNQLVRGVLVFLFLFFAVSFFYNPFYTLFPWNLAGETGVEGNIVGIAVGKGIAIAQQQPAPIVEQPAATPQAPAPVTEENKENITPPLEEITEPPQAQGTASGSSPSGAITLTIEDVKTATRDWGGKITEVSFVVENHGKTFIPKIKAYAYDEKTGSAYKASPLIKKYAALEQDKRLKATIDLSKFQFSDIASAKTLIVQLYDEGDAPGFANDVKLTEVEQKVTIV